MLREIKSNISVRKWLLYHLLTMVTFCFLLAALGSIGDYIILNITSSKIILWSTWTRRFIYYWFFSLIVGYFTGPFLLFILMDFIIQWNKLSTKYFILISLVASSSVGCLTTHFINSFYTPFHNKVAVMIVFMLAGLIYPFISKMYEKATHFSRY